MKRRFCQIAAVACLLFCGATLAMLVRSETTADFLSSPRRANWCFTALAGHGVFYFQLEHRHFGDSHGGEWEVYDAPASCANFVEYMHHRFLGFGYQSRRLSWLPPRQVYQVVIPLWFIALLSLLFAYVFVRAFRRRKYGQGFPVLPAKPDDAVQKKTSGVS